MPNYVEADVSAAIDAVLEGTGLRAAARLHGVPRQTLADRILGRQTNIEANQPNQRLSPALEKRLVEFILKQELIGYALTHAQIKSLAQNILKSGGDSRPLGRHWMDGFFRRNPELKTKKGIRIEYKRVDGASPENIDIFFKRLAEVSWIKPCNTYNADETGIMEGMGVNGLVVGSSEMNPKGSYVKGSQKRTWTSIIECISATGKALTPLVIFKSATIQEPWFARDFGEPWAFTNSENGWTSNDIALEWLEKIFLDETEPKDPSESRLLIVDGHGSHATDEFMYNCFRENIFMIFLPPHSSHVLQPLDLGVFSALKRAYRKFLGNLVMMTDSAPVGKLNFLRCYSRARSEALSVQNIKAGFRGTSIFPRNKVKAGGSRQVLAPRPATPVPPMEASPHEIHTPKGRLDAQKLLDNIRGKSPSTRLVFRKLVKALELKDAELAISNEKIRALEVEAEKNRASKRRKAVEKDPNSRFITIGDVIAAREGQEAAISRRKPRRVPEEHGEDMAEVQEPQVRRSDRIRVPTKRAIEVDDFSEDS